jgi:divalent metal cation (Fe/Co/Zn/Cd) transporter
MSESPVLAANHVGRAINLERMTAGWNLIETGVAIASGVVAQSVVLTGFGVDSGIEVVASLIVLKRLRAAKTGREPDEGRERRALRAVAITFYLLAMFLLVDGLRSLVSRDRPDTSVAGIVIAAAALVVMPMLALAKLRVGRRIGGATGALVLADAAETRLCALLSLATLGGLLAYFIAGWWWADPVAGFVIIYFAVTEGREAWRGDLCCD